MPTPRSPKPASNAPAKVTAHAANEPEPAAPANTPPHAASAQPATVTPLTASVTAPAAALVVADAPSAVLVVTAADIPSSPLAALLADPSQQGIARAKYQALHDQISSTRETLPGNDTANRTLLRDRAEEAQEVLTTLDRNDLQANTPAFTAAAVQIQQANNDMDDLKDKIGGIIHNIQATAEFIQIANEAVSAAAKFIA